jgi:glycosyltransferase A (GT-A) superfamily protein (DUF2064 family)
LAEAFLTDTLAVVTSLTDVRRVLSTPQPFPLSWSPRLRAFEVWLQGDGDLGARLERISQRALDDGAQGVLALGADSPGLPVEHLQRATKLLADHDAVLGPTTDGGFYLLGLQRCPPGLLKGLPWSKPCTLATTEQRLRERGLTVARTPAYFDVDVPDDVKRLASNLHEDTAAPATHQALRQLGLLGASDAPLPDRSSCSPIKPLA